MNKSNIGIIGGIGGTVVVLLGVLAVVYISKSSSNSNSNANANFNPIPNVEEDANRRSSLFTVRDTVSSVNNNKPQGLWSNMPKPEIKGGSRRRRKSRRKSRRNKK